MSVTEMLRDMRAAFAARTQYNRAADRLFGQSRELAQNGWEDWARETRHLAVMVRRDARGEYDGYRARR